MKSPATEIDRIAAAIKDVEAQIEGRTVELVPLYADLVAQHSSLRLAAKTAAKHGLRYANHASLVKLLRWGELCQIVVTMANGGGDNVTTPPTTVWTTPITAKHLWEAAGPEKLAELWLALPAEKKGAKAFAKAAAEQWPTDKPRPEVNAAVGKVQAAMKPLDTSIRPPLLPYLLHGVRKSDHLAKYLSAEIAARWGSVEAFAAKYPTKPTSD